jgi:hypothetical protein
MSNPDTLVCLSSPEAPLSRPWYRYFWPWLVIGLVLSAVIGSLASAYLAVHTTDVVVEHDDASE